jgi:predicted RNase H-like HicB family nuclease
MCIEKKFDIPFIAGLALGCVATGVSAEETEKNMIEAVKFHLEGMAAENMPLPVPSTIVRQVEIAA